MPKRLNIEIVPTVGADTYLLCKINLKKIIDHSRNLLFLTSLLYLYVRYIGAYDTLLSAVRYISPVRCIRTVRCIRNSTYVLSIY